MISLMSTSAESLTQVNPSSEKTFSKEPERNASEQELKDKQSSLKDKIGSFISKIRQQTDSYRGTEKVDVQQRSQAALTSLQEIMQPQEKEVLDYSPFLPESVRNIAENPTSKTTTTLTYESQSSSGDELKPGERFIYQIPAEFRGRVVRDIVLKHRKEPSRMESADGGWDPDGAYSRVLIKDSGTGEWVGWRDPAGYSSDKFAEPRNASDPENEALHDWVSTVGEVKPTLISVENVGQTDQSISNIHGLELVFFPEAPQTTYQERTFSPGTSFVDLEKGSREPRYGGGPNFSGKYPGALTLGSYSHESSVTDENQNEYLDSSGRLHIKLPTGRKLVSFEISAGDTHPDQMHNKDGHTGTLGWAKLYAGIRNSSGQVDYFMNRVNVPPAGVLAGGPKEEKIIKEGEELVVESRDDRTYVMGYRLGFASTS